MIDDPSMLRLIRKQYFRILTSVSKRTRRGENESTMTPSLIALTELLKLIIIIIIITELLKLQKSSLLLCVMTVAVDAPVGERHGVYFGVGVQYEISS